jgi:hypothetical protein
MWQEFSNFVEQRCFEEILDMLNNVSIRKINNNISLDIHSAELCNFSSYDIGEIVGTANIHNGANGMFAVISTNIIGVDVSLFFNCVMKTECPQCGHKIYKNCPQCNQRGI